MLVSVNYSHARHVWENTKIKAVNYICALPLHHSLRHYIQKTEQAQTALAQYTESNGQQMKKVVESKTWAHYGLLGSGQRTEARQGPVWAG